MTTPRISPADLERVMTAALANAGATPAMARATACALVAAELEGLGSHGASRIPQYCGHLRNGRATGSAVPAVVRGEKAACLVDAKGGLAFEACALAIAELVRRAKEFGVAFVAVTNSNHFGAAAYHLEPVAEAGLVGFAFTNSPGAMPAWGGKRAVFGTNPIAAAFPRRAAAPIVVDLSLTETARGKIMLAAREGKPIPLGWALDKEGNPTTDAKAALEGMMVPAGGVKGTMLALAIELLVAALAGSALSFESDSFFTEAGRPTRIGHAFLAIDPGHLAGREAFLERVETLVAEMLVDEGVRLPGARRQALREKAAKEGIAVVPDLLAKIRALAGEAAHA